ncbi:hypothetical protein A3I46_01880 [Candidatus Kaiserbacteria bacterium RIFCSPLOWO2_02_FULL_54_13]|uniref:DUF4349 domain-containing protein n=1 Tax=Candidatus Kaiserbacteria bacterium RIFCSPHIGHO2_02_FULL_54_22 TaxID=1798495 RepID=A0A1F6DLR4_9BACT|nr:MAG: hypothetical protein A3C19_00020 [Candidatus Kaiserbacteria bacterium RIFCSPHIGHO2_02_FULL_54_22]OGG67963.1 MAG: hypothetical protein A3E99_01365 [Candidatus Kaiserbacteria bacterium RIFCSPHIGHO2_12_FULL_54_16]OGG84086.1 MAG: hypothetical protein A3I46_01880 [Candidatus Kaiserbacteria bacterium RIFCSPLOWO2_02_FULL_54_13]OGG90819.1 MAG: hypothetical protein A3G12_03050 [Candidatus Kaiserbacteria bacterium RIFCSPLOWO2_12_FULL_54_10]
MNNNKLGFLPPYVSWLTIALALLAIITFFAVSPSGVRYVTQMGTGGGMPEYAVDIKSVPPSPVGVPMMDASNRYYPYPYPNPEVPITDTREFLKVYYNATMRTRDVPTLTRRVETTVRGYDGRIDSESSSEKYGYVSFALPQAKYDAFRTELEGLVGKRFITLNITSQNLLSQKVSIEEQEMQANTALADYKTARQKIVSAHASAVAALQAKIDAVEMNLGLRVENSPTFTAQHDVWLKELAILTQQLADENASYAKQLSNADANIKYAQDWVKAVQTQDATLLANVATVTGMVSIQWIGLWDIALLYLPGYWIPAIFAALAVLSYRRDRARVRKY